MEPSSFAAVILKRKAKALFPEQDEPQSLL
jgi:hypothetical protein